MGEQRQLVRSHSLLGYPLGQIPSPERPGTSLVVIQTQPYLAGESLRTVPAHMVSTATEQDVEALLYSHVLTAIDLAVFLGASRDTILHAIATAMAERDLT